MADLRCSGPLLLALAVLWSLRSALAAPSFTSEEMRGDLLRIQQCNETYPIGLMELNMALINRKISPGSTNFQCFVFCLLNKYKWMDSEGAFLVSNIKRDLSDSHLDHLSIEFLVYKCSSTNSDDKCEKAFEFTDCFWRESNLFPDESDEKYDDPNLFSFYH